MQTVTRGRKISAHSAVFDVQAPLVIGKFKVLLPVPQPVAGQHRRRHISYAKQLSDLFAGLINHRLGRAKQRLRHFGVLRVLHVGRKHRADILQAVPKIGVVEIAVNRQRCGRVSANVRAGLVVCTVAARDAIFFGQRIKRIDRIDWQSGETRPKLNGRALGQAVFPPRAVKIQVDFHQLHPQRRMNVVPQFLGVRRGAQGRRLHKQILHPLGGGRYYQAICANGFGSATRNHGRCVQLIRGLGHRQTIPFAIIDLIHVRRQHDVDIAAVVLLQTLNNSVWQRAKPFGKGEILRINRKIRKDLQRVACVRHRFKRTGKTDGFGQHLDTFFGIPHVAQQTPQLPLVQGFTLPRHDFAHFGPEFRRLACFLGDAVFGQDRVKSDGDDLAWAQALLLGFQIVKFAPDHVVRRDSIRDREIVTAQEIAVGVVRAAHREINNFVAQPHRFDQVHQLVHAVVKAHAAFFFAYLHAAFEIDNICVQTTTGAVQPFNNCDL